MLPVALSTTRMQQKLLLFNDHNSKLVPPKISYPIIKYGSDVSTTTTFTFTIMYSSNYTSRFGRIAWYWPI